jgi:hypothetical protein
MGCGVGDPPNAKTIFKKKKKKILLSLRVQLRVETRKNLVSHFRKNCVRKFTKITKNWFNFCENILMT